MKVYLVKKKGNVNATADFDIKTGKTVVKKGSVLSETIHFSERFRGAYTIEKNRKGVMKGNVLQKDMTFKSASTAANFVTGTSTNGLIAWKDSSGRTIKELKTKE